MTLTELDKIDDPEVRTWAMIWKVVPVLQKDRSENEVSRLIVDEISRLRTEGKLTDAQKKVLDMIGMNVSIDYDGF
ncbi:MAG: hypothetical protein UU16_C0022G0010 [Candidatus Woesebacteria bacterium GW2011_GWA2_40_7]|uniref:Uncharacterized protein n=3 Tax=Candidatus Woeseibacteriota TaxID=1752722 RepID=A0A0G0UUI8_9BACT|nr:MAG: hypothetical protein UT17_C0002G0220 [Candidatus Woesebacteria bacterium GW2011_GWB1_39_10]KKR73388.1 MAG: hypothetical protein UU16_C0022G0010 [Candidatus Woesebacteria bacterium GW2011_GWA2_40_7]KKR92429.1 MAG: hypothetical protein UU42_C0001G0033 [Candidatus Woesebacteria bacterium GW2011_GWA1_41_13b]